MASDFRICEFTDQMMLDGTHITYRWGEVYSITKGGFIISLPTAIKEIQDVLPLTFEQHRELVQKLESKN